MYSLESPFQSLLKSLTESLFESPPESLIESQSIVCNPIGVEFCETIKIHGVDGQCSLCWVFRVFQWVRLTVVQCYRPADHRGVPHMGLSSMGPTFEMNLDALFHSNLKGSTPATNMN
jgi:hypothetical protein